MDRAVALVGQGMTAQQAAEDIGGRLSASAIHREASRRRERAGATALSASPPLPPSPTPAVAPLPMSKRLEIDQLVARSPTWGRVKEILAAALAPYPEAARAVSRALRAESL